MHAIARRSGQHWLRHAIERMLMEFRTAELLMQMRAVPELLAAGPTSVASVLPSHCAMAQRGERTRRRSERLQGFLAGTTALLSVLALQGCAALPLAALGGAALESGAGAVVKTGTEYTMSGAAHRTFMVPMNAVRWAVLEAFERAGVTVESDDVSDDKGRIVAQLKHRTVSVRFTAFSASLTGMTLVVKQNAFVKDRATSSELLEQIEQVLAENPTFARSLRRPPQGDAAASPGY